MNPNQTYHDNSKCGVCGGPLEVYNDALCDKCQAWRPSVSDEQVDSYFASEAYQHEIDRLDGHDIY